MPEKPTTRFLTYLDSNSLALIFNPPSLNVCCIGGDPLRTADFSTDPFYLQDNCDPDSICIEYQNGKNADVPENILHRALYPESTIGVNQIATLTASSELYICGVIARVLLILSESPIQVDLQHLQAGWVVTSDNIKLVTHNSVCRRILNGVRRVQYPPQNPTF